MRPHCSNRYWVCRCICGKEREVRQDKLARSSPVCQCTHIEAVAPTLRVVVKHGMNNSPEFQSWRSMKKRCAGTKEKDRRIYVARGITICPQWVNSFEQFYSDMGPRPKGTSLDRIDNDKGYFPGNCRWATPTQQARNSRVPKLSERKAVAVRAMRDAGVSLSKIAGLFGVDRSTIVSVVQGKTWKEIPTSEDANEHPTNADPSERQQSSQGTRLQPGRDDAGDSRAEPGETGVEGC